LLLIANPSSIPFQKVETKLDETVVVIYFDDIDGTQICPELKAFRTHGVAKQKPASVLIYDYYDNCKLSFRASEFQTNSTTFSTPSDNILQSS